MEVEQQVVAAQPLGVPGVQPSVEVEVEVQQLVEVAEIVEEAVEAAVEVQPLGAAVDLPLTDLLPVRTLAA